MNPARHICIVRILNPSQGQKTWLEDIDGRYYTLSHPQLRKGSIEFEEDAIYESVIEADCIPRTSVGHEYILIEM
jgi:hypothetical protein